MTTTKLSGTTPREAIVSDLERPRRVAATLLRASPVIVLVAVSAAFATSLLAGGDDGAAAEARARLGLTDEVVWPFYDAARDRVRLTLEDAAFQSDVRQALADEPAAADLVDDLRLDVPINQAFVDVVVTSDDSVAAQRVVDAAASELVRFDQARVTAAVRAEAAAASTRLTEVSGTLQALESELASVVAEEARASAELRVASGPAIEVAERSRLTAQLRRGAIEIRRNDTAREQAELEKAIARLEGDVAAAQPHIELLRRAEPPQPAAEQSPWRSAAAAFAVALVLSAAAAVVWERERGRVRTAVQLRDALDILPLGDLAANPVASAELDRNALTAVALRDRAVDAGARLLAVVDADPRYPATSVATAALAESLAGAGYRVLVVDAEHGSAPAPERPLFDDARTEGAVSMRRPQQPLRLHLPSLRSSAVADTRERLAALADEADIVLVDCSPGHLGNTAAQWVATSCEARVLVASVGATRVHHVRRAMLHDAPAVLGVVCADRREAGSVANGARRPAGADAHADGVKSATEAPTAAHDAPAAKGRHRPALHAMPEATARTGPSAAQHNGGSTTVETLPETGATSAAGQQRAGGVTPTMLGRGAERPSDSAS